MGRSLECRRTGPVRLYAPFQIISVLCTGATLASCIGFTPSPHQPRRVRQGGEPMLKSVHGNVRLLVGVDFISSN